MALMLAPYNSAMRLGMGFNSYTQSLCVNDVVRKPGDIPVTEDDLRAAQLTQMTDAATTKQVAATQRHDPPQAVLEGTKGTVARTIIDGQKEVSQVVSWEASFVENSSDVLQKLDVSGALSIKMAGLGSLSGKAAFVDLTDIKKADINYLVHVKVVNQRLIADNITEFCPIDYIEPGQFTEIYGDCFISGFIEGGEFDAIVSITTEDTMKKNGISGSLELSANISGIDVAGSVSGSKDDNSTLKNAKTKISVTWSGGGDIRDDSIREWTLQNLKQVAMNFPDAVAACPQRVSAILTKYTSLRSYHEQTKKGSPLDYENAGVYTASLYDAYTDYKIMWKEVQAMINGLNMHQVALYAQEASAGLKKYAQDIKTIQEEKEKQYTAAIAERNANGQMKALVTVSTARAQVVKPIEKPLPANAVAIYEADVFGLETAARDCRFEMIKIVREVDAVTRDPKVACDPYRTSQYLSPSVFRLLLPTTHKVRLPSHQEWLETTEQLDKKKKEVDAREAEIQDMKRKLEAALITPRRDENNTLLASTAHDIDALHSSVQTSLSELAYKADEYRMQTRLEKKADISTGATFFNDLKDVQPGARPNEIRFWCDETKIKGLSIAYATGQVIARGRREDNPQHVLQMEHDEVITEMEIHSKRSGGTEPAESDAKEKLIITGIDLATSKCNILRTGKTGTSKHCFSMSDHRQWSFRGFFGFTFNDGFEDLGIVWGRDIIASPTSTVQVPPAKNLLGMGPSLQERAKKAMSNTKPAEHFYMGECISTRSTSSSASSFSATDVITGSSQISRIAFSVSATRLSGLKVVYKDGKELIHGAYALDQEVWNCEVQAPIIAAKLTVGKTTSFPDPFIDTVELICGNESGELPLWPLDLVTIRYLGDHADTENFEVVTRLVEQAPKLASANWTLRGFYGEESGGLITRLGLIWGCA